GFWENVMATAADPNAAPPPPPSNEPPPNLSALTYTATSTLVALVWGAAMLAVFGLWMRSKYEGDRPIVTNIFFVGALAAAALAGGYFLQQPNGVQTSPIQFLLDKIQAIKLGLVILAGVCLFTFGYLFYNYGPMAAEERRAEFGAYFPEYASLLFTSLLCIGC